MRTLSYLMIATGLSAALLTAPAAFAGPDEELKGAPIPARMDGHQPNSYRYGQLLRVDPVADPQACEQACTAEAACMSWSLVAVVPEAALRCELKRNIGRSISRPGAVSGIAVRFHPVAIPLAGTDDTSDLPGAPSLKSETTRPQTPIKAHPPANTSGGSSAAPIVYRPGGSNLDGGPIISGRTTITAGSNATPVIIKPNAKTGPKVITPDN